MMRQMPYVAITRQGLGFWIAGQVARFTPMVTSSANCRTSQYLGAPLASQLYGAPTLGGEHERTGNIKNGVVISRAKYSSVKHRRERFRNIFKPGVEQSREYRGKPQLT